VTGEKAELVRRATPLVQERMSVLREAREMLVFLVTDDFAVEPEAAAKFLGADQRPALQAARDALAGLDQWSEPAIDEALRRVLVDGLGLKPKHAFGPVRVAVTGRTVSPPLFGSLEVLGETSTLARLDSALAL
jgi:glutamyl-tRNA synthetase